MPIKPHWLSQHVWAATVEPPHPTTREELASRITLSGGYHPSVAAIDACITHIHTHPDLYMWDLAYTGKGVARDGTPVDRQYFPVPIDPDHPVVEHLGFEIGSHEYLEYIRQSRMHHLGKLRTYCSNYVRFMEIAAEFYHGATKRKMLRCAAAMAVAVQAIDEATRVSA